MRDYNGVMHRWKISSSSSSSSSR